MRHLTRTGRTASVLAVLSCALLLALPTPAFSSQAARDSTSGANDRTWVDHDGHPIPQPPDWDPDFLGHVFREAVVEPLSHAFDVPDKMLLAARALGAHTKREASNVNAFDEVPNSTWFTNRNHFRAVPVAQLRMGPDSTVLPSKPWTVTHTKHGGATPGFEIKDADGRKWLVKLEPRGYPQLCTGADMIARTLLHAAGYNVPHNEPVRFRREDLAISKDLARGAKGERLTDADLDSILTRGAVFPDGDYSAIASLFLSGHVLGSFSSFRQRPADLNDWYRHPNRRELRGLYVISSWLGFWDTKDADFLDTFATTRDSLGHVVHYILDPGSSFGADALGPKRPQDGFESFFDIGWTARRLVTLGFVTEPWRRARQDTGIPSVGRFESAVFDPGGFAPGVADLAYHEMTGGDDYWGAKIVASFSDDQIGAAVDAAHYDDPRAREFLVRALIARRDKIARYWFGRIAPLDFFTMEDGTLRFRDLGVDIGLAAARAYDVEVEHAGGTAPRRIHLRDPDLPLQELGSGASRVSIELSIAGSGARPVRVELTRRGADWAVAKVRHG
ncbi:MAG TPA: hypothetical protein VEU09_09485 [Candidatus Binatia bacterium]|nr:hypothetical protein [Candidatus Binatia bacterium]